jgi:hypothetical protein
VHDALFPGGAPKRIATRSVKEGIKARMRQKYARG